MDQPCALPDGALPRDGGSVKFPPLRYYGSIFRAKSLLHYCGPSQDQENGGLGIWSTPHKDSSNRAPPLRPHGLHIVLPEGLSNHHWPTRNDVWYAEGNLNLYRSYFAVCSGRATHYIPSTCSAPWAYHGLGFNTRLQRAPTNVTDDPRASLLRR